MAKRKGKTNWIKCDVIEEGCYYDSIPVETFEVVEWAKEYSDVIFTTELPFLIEPRQTIHSHIFIDPTFPRMHMIPHRSNIGVVRLPYQRVNVNLN